MMCVPESGVRLLRSLVMEFYQSVRTSHGDIIEDCTGNSNISDINDQIIPSLGNQSSGDDILECAEGFFF